MHSGNHYYGHDRILAEYAGIGTPPPIWGYLQHGWTPDGGFDPVLPMPRLADKFVWSRHNVAATKSMTQGRVLAVGAPFLYLSDVLHAEVNRVPVTPSRTLAYPFHDSDVDRAVGSHDKLIDALIAREGGDVTVCLYPFDFESPAREMYQAAGFRVICHGSRDDGYFLYRQLVQLLQHDRVISNRVSTAVWYAGALGLNIEVYGPVFGVGGAAEAEMFEAEQQQRWPDLLHGGLSGDAAKAVADEELGRDCMRTPEELKNLFGWAGPRRAMGPVIAKLVVLRRRLTAARTQRILRNVTVNGDG